jgi:predicted ATPase/class 3 adenylate cyclase
MGELPTGTVTFLFTDIEGSTTLAQQYPVALPDLLARHHAILYQAIQAHNGHVFQITGDAFCASFYTASDALKAALDAQRNLQHESWNPAPIKVRMGIHTGSAQAGAIEERAGGYVGYLTLTRVQRVMSTAHGGQVLLSNPTAELVRGELPADVTLRDMGEHRLKGLMNLEHLWQLAVPDLIADFPPLHTLNAIPNNLSTQLTSFIGREKEIAELKQELKAHRLVTLTGSGGTGKTRLSLQVAADLLDSFPNGVWFIELAPLTDPDLIPQTILSAIGISEQPNKAPLDILKEYLHEKKALIMLDNCEHVVSASAKVANALLNAAPNLKVLASSREALGVKGELSYPVPSLSLPDIKHLPAIEQLSQYEAVRLFIDRALLVAPHFLVDKDNAPFIAQICYRLDGIPLAIELAAARIKMMSVEQISARLDDRFRLLTGGARTALPRQQTLRALIDWSYNILSDNECLFLQRLSVFAGGWTLDAAEEVCAGVGQADILSYDVLDLLTQLVNKSLVIIAEHSQSGETRYRMLETIRQYARDKLFESGEDERVRASHLDWFTRFAVEAAQKLRTGERLVWMNLLEDEHANLRAALTWALEQKTVSALQLVGDLSIFWMDRGYASEGLRWIEQALALDTAENSAESKASSKRSALRAGALLGLGLLVGQGLGDFVRAHAEIGESVKLWRELGDKRNLAFALSMLAFQTLYLGDVVMTQATIEESVALAREAGDMWVLGMALGIQGNIVFQTQGDVATARALTQETLSLLRQTGSIWDSARALMYLGLFASFEADYPQARARLEESIVLFREDGNRTFGNLATSWLADVARKQGDAREAVALYRESLSTAQEHGNRDLMARCLECLAFVAIKYDENRPSEERLTHLKFSVRLLGVAATVREAIGTQRIPAERAEYDEELANLQKQLGENVMQAAWAEGRALTMEQAVAFALEETDV